MPPSPYCVRVSVVALMNAATSAHRIEVAAPSRAARRTGEPRSDSRARSADAARGRGDRARPGRAASATARAAGRLGHRDEERERPADEGGRRPGDGPDLLVDPHPAQHEREHELGHEEWLHHRHLTRCSASAWNTKAPARATQPKSHSGFDKR